MAVDIERDEEEQEVETKGSRKLGIIIGSILGLIIIAAIVFLVFFASGSKQDSDASGLGRVEGVEAGTAYYVALPRAFIFNVPGQRHDRLVQINVQLLVRGKRNDDFARQNIPLIEGLLHRTFSAATAESLRTSEGRLQLREAALNILRNEFLESTGSPVVEEVLFTGFVMQ